MSSPTHSERKRITPLWHYYGAFGALLLLTALAVGASRLDLGVGNTVIVMAVASLQVVIIAGVFMGFLYQRWILGIVALLGAGLVFGAVVSPNILARTFGYFGEGRPVFAQSDTKLKYPATPKDPAVSAPEERLIPGVAEPEEDVSHAPAVVTLSPEAKKGEALFTELGCTACHSMKGKKGVGPALNGLFGQNETLKGGAKVKVDEAYLKESILNPAAKIVDGYAPTMPPFQGRVDDAAMASLIAYMKAYPGGAKAAPKAVTLSAEAKKGQVLFTELGCNACHNMKGKKGVGPALNGIYGGQETLKGGAKVAVDDAYLKESILNPAAKVVDGFAPSMPPFQGRVDDAAMASLIAYMKAYPAAKIEAPKAPVPTAMKLSPEAEKGKKLYTELGCTACHSMEGKKGVGPALNKLYNTEETLKGGAKVLVDAAYVSESLLKPQAKVVDGFAPSMPSFEGRIDAAGIAAVVAYMKAYGAPAPAPVKKAAPKPLVKVTKEKIVILDKIYFETGKNVIKAVSYPVVDAVAAVLKQEARIKVLEVRGYTDNQGSAAFNRALSKKRAQAVRAYMMKQGIDGARLKAHGFGQANPVADNSTAQGRAENRRVEFQILNQ